MLKTILSNFLGIGVIVVTFTASQIFTDSQGSNQFFWAFISLLFGLAADRILSAVSQQDEIDQQKIAYERVIETVRGSGNIESMSAASALNYHLPNSLKSAITVNNTIIGGKLENKSNDHVDSQITALYKIFFETGGNSWTDTISVHELQSTRFEKIPKPHRNDVEHKLVVVRHNMPMINFTLLEFPEKERTAEVFFGWNYSSDANSDTVFRTKDEALIKAFSTLSSSLKEYSLGKVTLDYTQPPDRRTERQRSFVDKEGNWLTLSYRNDELVSLASISISFSQHLAEVSGRVFWRDGFSPNNSTIEMIYHNDEGKVSYTDTKMLVEYTEPQKGVCIYNFKKGEPLERLKGYFQNENQAFRTELSGFKIRPDRHEGPEKYAIRVLAAKPELNHWQKRVASKLTGTSSTLMVSPCQTKKSANIFTRRA
ncbi:MAG: hypothetical protein KJ875_15565 [Alphaproteobacteria bacterium]|uniref:Uncharacterized protein n=1 Tax=viral metagenome TaxID=1070528 RepID=A0A6M3JUW5_9ZZZZ|nr:hypothetical protein [Alphaproteobacteria bacterium]MBU2162324.1 hypothetical protein [Alphaproteobacteria bacterium]MBU2243626.1 hypothetical protein [Alphaproteobacteria bacterium]